MPHFILHHDHWLLKDQRLSQAMQIALETGAASGIMAREDIKVRAIHNQAILFGDQRRAFLHVEIAMLAGRSTEMKLKLAQDLVANLRAAFPDLPAISTEPRDMDPGCYKKSLV